MRRIRFSLSTLLGMAAAFTIACAYLSNRIHTTKAAYQAIERANGTAIILTPEEDNWIDSIGLGLLRHRTKAVSFRSLPIENFFETGVGRKSHDRGCCFTPVLESVHEPLLDIEMYFFVWELWRQVQFPSRATENTLVKLQGLGSQIEFLDLSNPIFTDAALEQIDQFPNLRHLLLEGSSITDRGIKHLKRLRKIECLILNGTKITDGGLREIERLSALTRLDVRNTHVSETGVRQLEQRLPNLHVQLHKSEPTN